MYQKTKITKLAFKKAKDEYRDGKISVLEYNNLLYDLLDILSIIEEDAEKVDYILKYIHSKTPKITFVEAINYTLSMN